MLTVIDNCMEKYDYSCSLFWKFVFVNSSCNSVLSILYVNFQFMRYL